MRRHLGLVILFFTVLPLTAGGELGFYIIKKGDTLSKVSRECNVPVSVLKAANRLDDAGNLTVGMRLTIPDVHVVKKGDTLYSLSRRYGISVKDLAGMNSLSSGRPLKINQKIYVVSTAVKEVEPTASPPETSGPVFWPHPGSREPYDGKIRGIVINGAKGDLVYSVRSGRVVWAGPYRGYGNVVLVNTPDGLVYGYMGIEELIVSVGEQIESGSALGRLGVYFHQTDAKLLFIVYNNLKRLYLDPQEVLTSSVKSKG